MSKELFFPTPAALTLLEKGMSPQEVMKTLGENAASEKATGELAGDVFEEARVWTKEHLIFLENTYGPFRGDSADPDTLTGHWWIDI